MPISVIFNVVGLISVDFRSALLVGQWVVMADFIIQGGQLVDFCCFDCVGGAIHIG